MTNYNQIYCNIKYAFDSYPKSNKLFIVKKINNNLVELYNFYYYINIKIGEIDELSPPSEHDQIERYILRRKSANLYRLFEKDLHTRQALIREDYVGQKDLASCLSLIQFIIRDNKLDMHIFVRSQNFDRNFLYDNQTYYIVYRSLYNKLAIKHNEIQCGKIFVHVTSLHRYLNEKT